MVTLVNKDFTSKDTSLELLGITCCLITFTNLLLLSTVYFEWLRRDNVFAK